MPRSNRPRRAGRPALGRGGARRPGRGSARGPRSDPDGPDGSHTDDTNDLESRLLHGGGRLEEHPDGAWRVRPVAGASATKAYLCPGCAQEIRVGMPHVVAWPAERLGAFGGPGDRRHWHTPCWAARPRRR